MKKLVEAVAETVGTPVKVVENDAMTLKVNLTVARFMWIMGCVKSATPNVTNTLKIGNKLENDSDLQNFISGIKNKKLRQREYIHTNWGGRGSCLARGRESGVDVDLKWGDKEWGKNHREASRLATLG